MTWYNDKSVESKFDASTADVCSHGEEDGHEALVGELIAADVQDLQHGREGHRLSLDQLHHAQVANL
eukprot:5623-Eustigmatos_ZCMA.PRE.1